ncbi:Hypothetical protein PENO1_111920 [Penicillium occitanis (nom. inval.)]|nr:Hypothetical protein PENO1_111920 [Penicillium occitanis (nom. inval.)]PCG88179.1 hypothetical protein PENOC_112160 [Penicillium occitanis (nom. inval.)]
MPEAVLKLYENQVDQKKPLSLEDANNLFHITCAQFNKVYVCLDALDELKDLRGLLKCLHDGPSLIQILLTARPYVQETVQEYFKGEHSITIKAHESDIQLFIENEIGGPNDIEPKAMDERLRMDILEKVVDSAKGIFLLPILQICAVLQATTLRDREEALKELPLNLGEAFTGTMTRIQQQPVALSERAAKIIAWIHLAERPLTIDELLCSLAIQDSDTCFSPRVIDQETSTVRLVHYSFQQHLLQQNEIFNLKKAQWHSKIACTCLTFLKFPPFMAGEVTEQSHTTVTILSYAATQWGHHLRRSEELQGAALEFGKEYLLANCTNHSVSLRLLYEVMYQSYWAQPDDVLPAHIATFFGLRKIMLHLSSKWLNLDMEDVHGRTPLSWAAEYGHEAVVKMLIEKLAAVDSVDRDGRTPLSWAVENGREAVVKMLIEKGAAVDSVDTNGQTPLS